jgi:cellulose synthase (UDP-forming)
MEPFGLTFLVLGAGILVVPFLDPKDNWARTALFGVCILLTWRYVGWRVAETLPPLAFRFDSLYAWTFSLVEVVVNIGWTLGFVMLSRTRNRSSEATARTESLVRQPSLPRVDILIATYNENESILRRTIVGALAVDFPGQRVWVLDDKRRAWLKELCDSKGANYLTRPDNKHAKAGNINHALDYLREHPDPPDFIAVLDADFVPNSDFLWRTIPLFQDQTVGLVQTPQHFFNWDPIQWNLLVGDVWPDEQRFFFDHVMASKDAWGSTFCCGTSSVIRMSALEAIGGFPTTSVTEDYLVTLKLDMQGWRTVYLNEPLTAGLAPEGMEEYLTQRGRWCLGLMQIVRSSLGPLSLSRLSFRYRIGLIDAFLYWAGTFTFKLLCLTTPIVYWFTGVTVGNAAGVDVIDHFLPYYVAVMITLYWATGGLVQPVVTDVSHVLTMPAALKATAIGLLKPHGHPFKVTAKGGDRNRILVHWNLIGFFGTLAGLTLLGLLYASAADFTPERQSAESTGIVLFWSIYNLIVLILAMGACIELPRQNGEQRFATSEPVRIFTGKTALTAHLVDISVEGGRILAASPWRTGEVVFLSLPEFGVVRSRIVEEGDESFTVEFLQTERLGDALIRMVYSGRYYRMFQKVVGRRLLGALVSRSLR